MTIVRVENVGRTSIKVPSKVYLMADPGVPLDLHPNCVDIDKARAVPNLKVTVIKDEPVQVAPPPPVVEVPELPEEVPPVPVAIDKLVRDADLQEVQVSAHNADAASGTRKRGRPRKTEE